MKQNIKVLMFLYVFFASEIIFSGDRTQQAVVRNQEEKKQLDLLSAIVVGGVAGSGEVLFPGQILSYRMNRKITREPFVWKNCYKGGFANTAAQFPITATQKVIESKASQSLEHYQESHLSFRQKMVISFLAGVGGALIETPSNAIQLYLQSSANNEKSNYQAFKKIGFRNGFRGFSANACMKEGPFAIGYQVLAPQGTKIAKSCLDSDKTSELVGGVSAGVLTAFFTQPGAVIRNEMQKGSCYKEYATLRSTIYSMYRKEELEAFYKGFVDRGIRIAIAIPLYAKYIKIIENMIH
tara:strand:- start:1190 stop:2077 length:888 start_codon:yes stop_codon:yes gene_type:complete